MERQGGMEQKWELVMMTGRLLGELSKMLAGHLRCCEGGAGQLAFEGQASDGRGSRFCYNTS